MSCLGLKWKVSLICLVLVVGPLITLGGRLTYQVQRYYLDEVRQALQSHARLAVEVIQEESLRRKPLNLALLCTELAETIGAEVYIVDPSGHRVADSVTHRAMELDRSALQSQRLSGGCSPCHAEVGVTGRISASAAFNNGVLPGHRVTVSESLFSAKRIVSKVRRMVLGTTVVAVLLATLLTLRLAGGVVEPIVRMSRMAEVIAEGDFNQRLDSRRRDEVGRLAESLNRMTERVQSMITRLVDERNRRRKFMADISHEFRTPVTALRTTVDALVEGGMDDAEVRQDFLKALDNQSEKLCNLVNDLLSMSAVESAEIGEERICVPLSEALQRILREVRPSADRKGLRLVVDVIPEVRVIGDPRQLEVLLANLVDNAIKYNRQGGSISIEARQERDCVVTTVSDTGIGIRSEDLDHIFDRFYRSEQTRAKDLQGTGLGLAIVKEIVEAHGGRIHAESVSGKGSSFTFTLPACGTNPPSVRPEGQPT